MEKSRSFSKPEVDEGAGDPKVANRRTRLAEVGRIVVIFCVFVQSLSLLPSIYKTLSGSLYRSDLVSQGSQIEDSAEDWKDDVWPIRQPTPWDISTDFPYTRTLEFDVEEGTWLRLDVHPQSGEIVFDMLGDLYCLPPVSSATSERHREKARPILLGIPHDSDPHFSPDGKLLAYRSDAELGVENIWVTEWKGCESMDLRPDVRSKVVDPALIEALATKALDEDTLAQRVQETIVRKQRRLIREGRLSAKRVTNETYRWVSDARFHPSGKKLIATKWYTSSRSLGAGEGWEYKLPSDGESIPIESGRRIIGRRLPLGWPSSAYGSQQVGPEQFIWSGEDSLIYSQNVIDTNGAFQYSKDVHSGVYAIFAKNLTTNTVTTLVDFFPGGATRPELSRDGKTLAFVRRVRDQEALVLKDLQSGSIHHIWYGLNYDLGVISAPMGTYPSFSFTPSDDAIIIWAAGKIWRVPLKVNELGEKIGGGEPTTIPFIAHVEKRIAETRSSKTDLLALESAEKQRLHAFTDLAVSENGTRVAFQGAGVTYYLDVDYSTPGKPSSAKRVPVLHPEQAYHSPSFVPGTEHLVIHSRWSDRNFSSFEIADLSSGIAYDVSEGLPLGRYLKPVLCGCSGSERKIAFVKTAGDLLTGNVVATANPGLYIGEITLPETADGVQRVVSIENIHFIPSDIEWRDIVNLQFLHGNAKLLVQQSDYAFVVDLGQGPDKFGNYNQTAVAEGLMTQEIAVSANHIAFVDFYLVYVVDKNNAGEPLWSKPGSAPKSLARVSLDGGHDVHWTKSGDRVFWLLGPYLHSLEVSRLADCSSDIARDEEKFGIFCVKDLLDVVEIGVSYSTDISRLEKEARLEALRKGTNEHDSIVFAITNSTILTMDTGHEHRDLISDATLVIRGGVIESIGLSEETIIPQGATVYNANGGFVTPGFIDVHAHWSGFEDAYPARSWELETFLAYGVTTLHNPSSDNVRGFVERGRVENGGMVGPRIFHTGNVIYGAGAPGYHNDVADLDDAFSALIRIKAEGGPASFSYKNYNQYSRASRQRLLLAAQNLSMLCVPEGGMNQDWDITYIIDGMTTVEHALPVPVLYDDVINLFALSGTGYTPTHIVNYGGTMGEQFVWERADTYNNPKLRRFTSHDILAGITETTHRPKNSYAFFNTSESTAKMVKKGLRAHIGAHGEPPLGLIYHAEMFFFAQGGLSNYEILRAATIDAAITLGLDSSIGSLSKGKLADFVVYPPHINLLEIPIKNSKNISLVARGGRIWDAETMVEYWPVKGRRAAMPPINAD